MTRRGKICARGLEAGAGSCAYWWESCPAKVGHCFQRFIREHGTAARPGGPKQITMDQAKEWARARDADREPQPEMPL